MLFLHLHLYVLYAHWLFPLFVFYSISLPFFIRSLPFVSLFHSLSLSFPLLCILSFNKHHFLFSLSSQFPLSRFLFLFPLFVKSIYFPSTPSLPLHFYTITYTLTLLFPILVCIPFIHVHYFFLSFLRFSVSFTISSYLFNSFSSSLSVIPFTIAIFIFICGSNSFILTNLFHIFAASSFALFPFLVYLGISSLT